MAWYDHKFSNQYEEAKKVLKNETFADSWKKLVQSLVKLMGDTGFNAGDAGNLDELRKKSSRGADKGWFKGYEKIGEDEGLLAATGDPTKTAINGKTRKKAAALKFLRHVYLLKKWGSHKVWIHSLPTDFSDWPHWAFDSGTDVSVKTLLRSNSEKFSEEQKKNLSHSTQEAIKWCQKTLIVIANAAAKSNGRTKTKALELVKRWFADENTTDEELNNYISELSRGFKSILGTLNRGQIILTDFPTLRNASNPSEVGLKMSEAFVWALANREPLDVVYIEEEFFGSKNVLTGLTNWTRILIHELSHLVCGTTDVKPGPRYAWYGIAPNAANFPGAKAITNAENWAFFAADCAGALSDSERNRALTVK